MKLVSSIVIALSLSLVGCGGGDDQNGGEAVKPPPPPPPPPPAAAGGSVEFALGELDNSGKSGKATLKDTPDGVRVVVRLTPATGRHPAHIHEGRCPEPRQYPTWALLDVGEDKSVVVLGTGLSGEPEPTLADLRSKPYAINVHKSNAEPDVYIACGDIPTG